jgi:hypothetical protein
MAQNFKALKDEEIVRSLKSKVTESGVATYTEIAIDTQLSIERGVIWLIHSIEFYIEELGSLLGGVIADGTEEIELHVARESKAAICDPNDADLIQGLGYDMTRAAAIGTDAGPLYVHVSQPDIFKYAPPLPYASQTIYFGIKSTRATVMSSYLRILYTIRSVSDKYFFRVAQALLG